MYTILNVKKKGLKSFNILNVIDKSPVESLYIDAHEPRHPAFDIKCMKFDARPNATRTFGLRIKLF